MHVGGKQLHLSICFPLRLVSTVCKLTLPHTAMNLMVRYYKIQHTVEMSQQNIRLIVVISHIVFEIRCSTCVAFVLF